MAVKPAMIAVLRHHVFSTFSIFNGSD